jgi:DNA-binding response OmpR family regulator
MQTVSSESLSRTSRSLLLVDDDDLTLSMLAERLSAAGYEVSTAHNGLEARQLLETRSFPVVITDLHMPEMSGLELVDSIRSRQSREQGSPSYCIVWSIRSAEEDRQRSFGHGVDDHVSKAAPHAELNARIEAGFAEVETREAVRRSRAVRNVVAVTERSVDVDSWNVAANRLHAEIRRAQRLRRPLSVLLLHVEYALAKPEAKRLAPQQFACLVGAVAGSIRQSIDWVAPLDATAGVARLLVVLPETAAAYIDTIRQRVRASIDALAITDEFAELAPECAVGVVSVEEWNDTSSPNAAALVAAAERRVEKLVQASH